MERFSEVFLKLGGSNISCMWVLPIARLSIFNVVSIHNITKQLDDGILPKKEVAIDKNKINKREFIVA